MRIQEAYDLWLEYDTELESAEERRAYEEGLEDYEESLADEYRAMKED